MVIGVISGGCQPDSFVPPRPPELAGSASASAEGPAPAAPAPVASSLPGSVPLHSGARAIELIAASRNATESDLIKLTARAQAGRDGVRIRIAVPGEPETPGSQADLVRRAAEQNPLALIVEPIDPADAALAGAVTQARDRGIPVIVVGHQLDAAHLPARTEPESVDPARKTAPVPTRGALIRVVPEPFTRTSRSLVESAVRNAKNSKLAPEGAPS